VTHIVMFWVIKPYDLRGGNKSFLENISSVFKTDYPPIAVRRFIIWKPEAVAQILYICISKHFLDSIALKHFIKYEIFLKDMHHDYHLI
jgi:hypothetical protein